MMGLGLPVAPTDVAPLPLTRIQAIHRAAEMKRRGWTWVAISRAMGEYHGHWLSADTWRMAAVTIGLEFPKRAMTPAKQAVLLQLHARNRGDRVAV